MKRHWLLAVMLLTMGAACNRTIDEGLITVTADEVRLPQVEGDTSPADDSTTEPATAPAEQPVKAFSLIAKRSTFSPANIVVNQGDLVRLTVKSIDVTHGFFLPAFDIDLRLPVGEPVPAEFTADQTGTFEFSSNVFSGKGTKAMFGTVVVK